MGYVLKPSGTVFIRIDNYQIIQSSEIEKLPIRLVQKRQAFIIFIYPEANGEFDYFYARHILHNVGKGKVSVIVVDKDYPINRVKAKLIFEKAIKEASIKEKLSVISVKIPQIFPGHILSVREWDLDNKQFTSEPKDCCFVLRDIKNVTSRNELFKIANSVSAKEFNAILKYINNAKKPDDNYIISKVIFIGKYFVATQI